MIGRIVPRVPALLLTYVQILLIHAMQTLGAAIGDWQETGLSYSCYLPALRNTSELSDVSAEFPVCVPFLRLFYFLSVCLRYDDILIIGCGLSAR